MGRFIGAKDRNGATCTVGSAICIFAVMAVGLTLIMEIGAPYFAKWMNAPDLELTTLYLRICGAGLVFITAYNGISGLFKGTGNSNLPLVFVGIACVVNIALDLILVIAAGLGVAGVAIATISAQAVSVVLSLIIISRKKLPFDVKRKSIRFHSGETKSILLAGVPLATQDFLTNLSFVVINSVAIFKKKDSIKMQIDTPVPETTALHSSVPGPIITISREHGSCGKQIGGILAEKLGVPFYYKEVAAMAAEESGLHREFISDINRNTPSVMKELYLSNSVIQNAVQAQDRIIRKIADQGSCVIVGRAADYILRDYPNVIRIFIYASEEYKVKQIMKEYGDSESKAKKNVQQRTASRSSYYRSITGKVWGDVHNYDIVIDSSIGVEKSVEKIMNMIADR